MTMTALPYDPHHYYTVDEFAALPEDTSAHYELQDGLIIMSPKPAREHMFVSFKLAGQIDLQLPRDLCVLGEIDVDLQLATPVVRAPDLLIAKTSVFGQRGLTTASDLVLAVEVLSPSSVRTDTVTKPVDYADAGIPNYWVIDPNSPVTATVYHLVDGAYEESQRAAGQFTVSEPCALTIDLDALLPPS